MGKIVTPVPRPLLFCAVVWTIGMSLGLVLWEGYDWVRAGECPVDDRLLLGFIILLTCFVVIIWWEKSVACLRTHIVTILACTLGAASMVLYITTHQPYSIDQMPLTNQRATITVEMVTVSKVTKSLKSMQAMVKILDLKVAQKDQNPQFTFLRDSPNLYAWLVYPKTNPQIRMLPKQRYQIEGVLEKQSQPSKNGIWYPITRLTDAQLVVYVHATQKHEIPESSIRALPSPSNPIQTLREAILSKLASITSKNDAGFLAGVLFGVTERLDPAVQDAYTLLGITHLLAVSGMNIELLIRPCLWALRLGRVTYRYAAIVTACMIVLYGLLTDGGPSVNRAVIMGVTMLVAGLFYRQPDPLSALSFSCMVCLWSDPSNLANVGFQFSFLASLFLILFSPKLSYFLRNQRIPHSSAIAVFVVATIATLPIQLYVFAQWSPYSIVTNLLLEPLMPICMITLMLVVAACYCFWPVAYLLGFLLHGLVWLFTVPVLWLYQRGLPILQVNEKEAVWSYGLYGVMAVWLLIGGKIGTQVHTKPVSGNDISQPNEKRCQGQ